MRDRPRVRQELRRDASDGGEFRRHIGLGRSRAGEGAAGDESGQDRERAARDEPLEESVSQDFPPRFGLTSKVLADPQFPSWPGERRLL